MRTEMGAAQLSGRCRLIASHFPEANDSRLQRRNAQALQRRALGLGRRMEALPLTPLRDPGVSFAPRHIPPTVESAGVIPPGNSDDKRWTQRKAKPARRAPRAPRAGFALGSRRRRHGKALRSGALTFPGHFSLVLRRADIRLTSGKGLADLTVPLSTLIDTVVKQNKAREKILRGVA